MNTQEPENLEFQWDRSGMGLSEDKFLLGAGILIGAVRHLDKYQHRDLLVEVLSAEALATSEIEGQSLARAGI